MRVADEANLGVVKAVDETVPGSSMSATGIPSL